MGNKNKTAHRMITFVIGSASIVAVTLAILVIGFNFKKIAVSLNLPFELPASWYSDDETASGTTSILSDGNSSSLPGTAEWFSEYLQAFLITDFDEFSEPSKVNNDQLICFGIYSAVTGSEAESFKKDENYSSIIPAEDVTAYANKLISGVTITDKTVGDFTYSTTEKSYVVPTLSQTPKYMTFITDVKSKSNSITEVTISFFPYDKLSATENMPSGNPEKTMIVKLENNGGTYKILSYLKT